VPNEGKEPSLLGQRTWDVVSEPTEEEKMSVQKVGLVSLYNIYIEYIQNL
jgi:hypothetical protein